jgi:AbrB family looped-hinge helix DNA binding protein
MNQATTGTSDVSLVKIKDRAQITLPPEVRQALNVGVGDYLEAEVVEGGVLLKPVAVVERTKAWDELLRIVNRPKWEGPGPEPSEDEVMATVVKEIRALRREYEGRPR